MRSFAWGMSWARPARSMTGIRSKSVSGPEVDGSLPGVVSVVMVQLRSVVADERAAPHACGTPDRQCRDVVHRQSDGILQCRGIRRQVDALQQHCRHIWMVRDQRASDGYHLIAGGVEIK